MTLICDEFHEILQNSLGLGDVAPESEALCRYYDVEIANVQVRRCSFCVTKGRVSEHDKGQVVQSPLCDSGL